MFSLSVEVFPPKNAIGLDEKLARMIAIMQDKYSNLHFDFISVTYGANGGNRRNALDVARVCQGLGFRAVSHLTCTNTSREEMRLRLTEVKCNGIFSILALRGDPIPESTTPSYYEHTSDLLKGESDSLKDFEVGVACYPELFQGMHDINEEIKYLKLKQDLGAKYAITQVFFDNSYYYTFVRYARAAGITIPIYPGIMPVTSVKSIYKMAKLCNATIPSDLYDRLQRYVNNDECMRQVGLNYAASQIDDLIAHGVPGIHIYSMNSPEILDGLLSRIQRVVEEEQKNDRI